MLEDKSNRDLSQMRPIYPYYSIQKYYLWILLFGLIFLCIPTTLICYFLLGVCLNFIEPIVDGRIFELFVCPLQACGGIFNPCSLNSRETFSHFADLSHTFSTSSIVLPIRLIPSSNHVTLFSFATSYLRLNTFLVAKG